MLRILQCNVNPCWAAQALLDQVMIDLQAGLCVVAEPVRIPDSPHWFGSDDGRAAIRYSPDILRRSCLPVRRGRHFVAVKCDDITVISSYVSPNLPLNGF